MNESPTISVTVERRITTGAYEHCVIHASIYKVPFDAHEGILEEAMATTELAIDKLTRSLRSKIAQVRQETLSESNLPKLKLPERPEPLGSEAFEIDNNEKLISDLDQEATLLASAMEDTFAKEVFLPDDHEVQLPPDTLEAFGVKIATPPIDWMLEPITRESDIECKTRGQLVAVNTWLSENGATGSERFNIINRVLLLIEHPEYHWKPITSTADLTKWEAAILLDLSDRTHAMFDEMVLDRKPQPDLAEELFEKRCGGVGGYVCCAECLGLDDKCSRCSGRGYEDCPRCKIGSNARPGYLPDDPFDVDVSEWRECKCLSVSGAKILRGLIPVPTPPSEQIVFSASQQAAIDLIESSMGKPAFVFVTGKAGTGKSTVTNHVRDHYSAIVLAPTGKAAVNVKGQTIHSFFKLKPGPLARKASSLRESTIEALFNADCIIIDEISMVRVDVIDAIDVTLRTHLGVDKPFGGKTIIAVGDMWQMEPVVRDEKSDGQTMSEKDWLASRYKSPFWFDAEVFQNNKQISMDEDDNKTIDIQMIELTDVFRQTESDLVDSLNLLRVGDVRGLDYFNRNCVIDPLSISKDNSHAVSITMGNKRCSVINNQRLSAIDAPTKAYVATITGEWKEHPAPEELILKVGAQVMFNKNIYTEFYTVANGTVAEVIELPDIGGPIVRTVDGHVIKPEPALWEQTEYTYDHNTKEISQNVTGTFTQYPLQLAWAVTTHKSQGQTLDEAIIELEMPAFAHGQLYVAMSRVRTSKGLKLRRRLKESDIIVHPRVEEFMLGKFPPLTLNLSALAS
jgi:nucleoside-triphosphatase THEP1